MSSNALSEEKPSFIKLCFMVALFPLFILIWLFRKLFDARRI